MTPDRKDEDRPFIERWSRRKLETEAGEPAEEDAPQVATTSEDDEQHRLRLEHNRQAAEAIDLESLDAQSDFSAFLKEGVPKALKSAAMRTLWRSSPVFANLDGLNDYDENFADPARVKKFAGSAWEVGKGYLRKQLEAAEIEDAVADAPTEQAARAADDHPEPDRADNTKEASDDDEIAGQDISGGEAGDTQIDAEIGPEVDAEPELLEKVPLRTRLALKDWETQ